MADSMPTCPACGARLQPGACFCNGCGAPVGASEPQPAPPPGYAPAVATAGRPTLAAPRPAKERNSCLIIAIVVAALVVIGACCIGGLFLLRDVMAWLEKTGQLGLAPAGWFV